MTRKKTTEYQKIAVKIGTSSLTYPNGRLNVRRMEELCKVLSDLQSSGKQIILVTSGAIAVGAAHLNMEERPRDIKGKQAASAVGQAMLMQIYRNFFARYETKVAQILLTPDVVDSITRRQNARNTLETLLAMNVIPIVNANDTIATEELEFSDNDTLSAHVAILAECDLLVMLTDTDGLYDRDPREEGAALYREISEITREIEECAGGAGSAFGTGGMKAKVIAAKMANSQNIDALVASGEDPKILWRIFDGERIGTLFCGCANRVAGNVG